MRGIDGSDPIGSEPVAGEHEHRQTTRSRVGTGTLACPRCDAPVALAGPVSPVHSLDCPFCRHTAAVRDFLSLAPPTRPARVVVRVVVRA
jgi:hypothetical protein